MDSGTEMTRGPVGDMNDVSLFLRLYLTAATASCRWFYLLSLIPPLATAIASCRWYSLWSLEFPLAAGTTSCGWYFLLPLLFPVVGGISSCSWNSLVTGLASCRWYFRLQASAASKSREVVAVHACRLRFGASRFDISLGIL